MGAAWLQQGAKARRVAVGQPPVATMAFRPATRAGGKPSRSARVKAFNSTFLQVASVGRGGAWLSCAGDGRHGSAAERRHAEWAAERSAAGGSLQGQARPQCATLLVGPRDASLREPAPANGCTGGLTRQVWGQVSQQHRCVGPNGCFLIHLRSERRARVSCHAPACHRARQAWAREAGGGRQAQHSGSRNGHRRHGHRRPLCGRARSALRRLPPAG